MATELLGVFSPYLAEVLAWDGWEEPTADFLGIDVVSVGEWSLLRALLESTVADKLTGLINSQGLLSDASSIAVVERIYRQYAAENIVEPIADIDSDLVLDPVRVFSMGMKLCRYGI